MSFHACPCRLSEQQAGKWWRLDKICDMLRPDEAGSLGLKRTETRQSASTRRWKVCRLTEDGSDDGRRVDSSDSSRQPSLSGWDEKQAGVRRSRVHFAVRARLTNSWLGDTKLHTCGSRAAGRQKRRVEAMEEAVKGDDEDEVAEEETAIADA